MNQSLRKLFVPHVLITLAIVILPSAPSVFGADAASPSKALPARDPSLRNEVQHALEKGLQWLQKDQNAEGWWSTADHPAVTALALTAYQGDPGRPDKAAEPEWVKRGYSFLLRNVKPDGGIYAKGLLNYNTSLSTLALLAAHNPQYDAIILKARQFTIKQQADFDEPGKLDNAFDGGIGYGDRNKNSDLSNTLDALEALYHSKQLLRDKPGSEKEDLNWQAAIHFLEQCQNLPAYNKQPWASDAPQNKGGFVYAPDKSMAGGETNLTTGRVALRSYGSMSYAGLLSYIYADLKRDDPRVLAVFDWLCRNYTLDENPGMGPQGIYYYYHTMSKALTAYNVDVIELKDGKKINWRKDLALRLINLQKPDGSWANDNNRWWEKDSALVTAYGAITLEMISRGL